MDPVVVALRDQLDELDSLVAHLGADRWARPSACPGWSVRDVLLHLAQTNEVAIASVEDRWEQASGLWADDGATDSATVDDLAGAAVAAETNRTGDEVYAWWADTAERMVAAFDARDPAARVEWVVGDMAARTLCTTRIAETWIHTTDIAAGLGVDLAPTDRLRHVCRLVHRTLPYAFARAGRDAPGRVRFDLDAPDGSTWSFGDADAPTAITGSAHDLCRVAGQRADAADTNLRADGPDADAVLELMRTFA